MCSTPNRWPPISGDEEDNAQGITQQEYNEVLEELDSVEGNNKDLRDKLDRLRIKCDPDLQQLRKMKLVSNESGYRFTEEVVDHLNDFIKEDYGLENFFSLTEVDNNWHANGEVTPRLGGTVRGKNVYAIGLFDNVFKDMGEYGLIMRACHDDDKDEINAIFPCMPFQRQERKADNRQPNAAKWYIDVMEKASKADRMFAIDLHAEAIPGFPDEGNMVNLRAGPLFRRYIKDSDQFDLDLKQAVALSPDLGSNQRTRNYAEELGTNIAAFEKERDKTGEPKIKASKGVEHIKDSHVLIFDDMVDTAGTIKETIEHAEKYNPKSYHIFATHPILSDPATERIKELKNKGIDVQVYGTDSIPHSEEYLEDNKDWLNIVSASEYVARAIYNCQQDKSIGDDDFLFPDDKAHPWSASCLYLQSPSFLPAPNKHTF